MTTEVFCVYQTLMDGTQEKVRDWVSLEEAIVAARHYPTSVAARMGLTTRVIIVDSGDCIVYEWIYPRGIVFPMPSDASIP